MLLSIRFLRRFGNLFTNKIIAGREIRWLISIVFAESISDTPHLTTSFTNMLRCL